MGLSGGDGVKVETSEVGKLKDRKKDKGSDVEDIGCWTKLRFIGSCISSRSKVDNSISGITTNCGNSLKYNLSVSYVLDCIVI